MNGEGKGVWWVKGRNGDEKSVSLPVFNWRFWSQTALNLLGGLLLSGERERIGML